MAARIRLARVGSKKNPIFRVVVADRRAPRDGRFIEILGRYNPQTDPSTIDLDTEKIDEWIGKGETLLAQTAANVDDGWIGKGAEVSNTVKKLMKAAAKSAA